MITEKELYERCRCVEFLQLGIIEKRLRQNLGIDENEPTIEDLKDQNINDLKELYELYEAELSRFKHVISARDLTIKSLTSMCQSGGTERNKLASTIDELKETIRLEERSVLNQKYHDDLHEKDATIKYLKKTANEVIACLRMQVDDLEIKLVGNRKLVDDLKAELSARKEDSEVLEKIHTLIDEWSIHKNGGHQSFSILHKIDDLLASNLLSVPEDTTIDEEPEISVTFAYMELP